MTEPITLEHGLALVAADRAVAEAADAWWRAVDHNGSRCSGASHKAMVSARHELHAVLRARRALIAAGGGR